MLTAHFCGAMAEEKVVDLIPPGHWISGLNPQDAYDAASAKTASNLFAGLVFAMIYPVAALWYFRRHSVKEAFANWKGDPEA